MPTGLTPSDGRPRAVIESVSPTVDNGRFAAKRILGDTVRLEADVFIDGHDRLAVEAEVWRPGAAKPFRLRMLPLGNDRWAGEVAVDVIGRWSFRLVARADPVATWHHDTLAKVAAGADVAVELEVGARLVESALGPSGVGSKRSGELLVGRLRSLAKDSSDDAEAIAAYLEDHDVKHALTALFPPGHPTTTDRYDIVVDPVLARFSTWYELFPRSASPDPGRPGTLADVEEQLDSLAGLHIDVLYLPPIHPIGRTHRKGHNGATTAAPGHPGSPWGIGSEEGGHEAVHPELGTTDDVTRLVRSARSRGIEVALDIAFQCSPDHPWVKEHPTWFTWRPDGTVQCAENPPKRYQDIYPLNFETPDWADLWSALEGVFRHWIDVGVRVFRVDNPHTKPFPFWEWCIGRLKADHPEVLFLSEAFTRPRVMHRLAKLGFSQSYTYFTWRNTAEELREYLTELTTPPGTDYFRPNLWPNTPDILHEYLQHGGRAAFVTRLVLAGGLAANYGIYGPPYERFVGEAREPGSEEYLNTEKFQVRHWGPPQPDSLRPLIARLNKARREHRALQADHGLVFHHSENPHLLCWSKTSADGTDRVLAVVNLDPHHPQDGDLHLHLDALGLGDGDGDDAFMVEDLLSADEPGRRQRYEWHGARNWVRLEPDGTVAHLFHVAPEHARSEHLVPEHLHPTLAEQRHP